jgi:cytidylate kinase
MSDAPATTHDRDARDGAPGATAAIAIAIDGPAGAGKSTVSRMVARRLGLFLLDTGAIYRSLALLSRRAGIAWTDGPRLGELAGRLDVRFEEGAAGQRVIVDGEDVSEAIRTPEISGGASMVSALPEVRAALLELQRSIARSGGCVVEGRDIGTVVLPWAPLKLFVTASVHERARRRHAELLARGQAADLAAVEAEIRERDERDRSRAVAPLRQAEDAILVDTSDLTVDEVVARIEAIARQRLQF